ncbi:hypothetical protein [Azospirillum sp. SYSU D00513]|uniref:hypothetical protein n=1 Tax=Azospirillum sp. SYSU D00513 TaxID=2812561 RepID=UPI001A975065|nr:hypothetical protein [Azospirillum sp. SYSU D00513]
MGITTPSMTFIAVRNGSTLCRDLLFGLPFHIAKSFPQTVASPRRARHSAAMQDDPLDDHSLKKRM